MAFSQERVVERNVVYSNGAPMLVQEGKWNDPPGRTIDHNYDWNTSGRPSRFPGNRAFEARRETGQDPHSQLSDLGFGSDPRGLSAQAGLAGLAIGLQPFDATKAGVPTE